MFEVIGERINAYRKLVQAAVAERNADYIIDDQSDSSRVNSQKFTSQAACPISPMAPPSATSSTGPLSS